MVKRRLDGVLCSPVLMHYRITLALSLLTLSAFAADPLPGHSSHGEAFNEGPRQAAKLIAGTGKVSFIITTKNKEAQAFFNQGIGQMHGFWYFEAERSFRQVSTLDKECAMAFWGMAMANVNNEKRAREFVKKAVALKLKASDREKLWIGVLETFYKEDANDKRDKKQRALDYIRDLENLVHSDPDDVEAKAFLAWKIWHANGDAPITSHQAVDALLDQVFASNPQHPAHHYRIHLWDNRKPERALKSAAQNGQASPGIAHMWHMPGHTYSKLKRFDDALWQQEASTRVDHAYMIQNWILPDQIHNYAHNEEWMIRNFNEVGRVKEAIAMAESLIRTPRHPSNNTLDKQSCSASYGRTRLIDTLTRWELWEQLLKATEGPLLGPVMQPTHEAARLRARGLAFYQMSDAKALASTITALAAIETKAREKKAQEDKDAAAKAKKDDSAKAGTKKEEVKKPEAKKDEAKKPEAAKKPDAIAMALIELRAMEAVLAKAKNAKEQLAKATDLPKPLTAELYLKLDDLKKAEELLKNYPQDLAGLAAKALIQQTLGKMDEARKTFEEVRKLSYALEMDLPVVKKLTLLAKALKIEGRWQAEAPKRLDVGVRPDLKTLGPIHWQPPVAPKWEALTPEGQVVKSAHFEGKPHVLIFYLGAACTHCMTQVNAFAKAAPDYEKAGISLAAISLEPLSLVGRVAEQMTTKKMPPFPVYCDPSLAAFKIFRAYDDFEEEALHAAILIDAKGRLRWLDVSWEPFTDTAFLLAEAKRLLSLPEE